MVAADGFAGINGAGVVAEEKDGTLVTPKGLDHDYSARSSANPGTETRMNERVLSDLQWRLEAWLALRTALFFGVATAGTALALGVVDAELDLSQSLRVTAPGLLV